MNTLRFNSLCFRLGILDVFLSIIAKALTLQVKIRGKNGNIRVPKEINTISLATSLTDNLSERWWLKGSVNKNLAELIIHLIKDMASVSVEYKRRIALFVCKLICFITCLSSEVIFLKYIFRAWYLKFGQR